jgi:photosystem II stability/assembly factor-like uncharacterized protein/tetratricopeptide (TPR) repeat protein
LVEMINPYIAGAPVTETSMFFGREDVFDWIERSLTGRYIDHILVLHGQRRVGKTSVLKQLQHRLPERYIPVFFDLQGRTHTTLDRFLWWLAREIVRVLKQDRGISLPRPARQAFTDDPDFLDTQFLPALREQLGDKNILLTFDEFDTLEETTVKEDLARPLIDYLRRLMDQEGLNFIFSIGSSGRKLENMQAAYTEFFKAALYKKISFLQREDAYNLIERPTQGLVEYERRAVRRIYEVTSGHPYFTQLVCHEIFSQCQKSGLYQVDVQDVEAVLDDVVERGTVNLKFVWDEASDLEKWVLAGLAHLDDEHDQKTLSQFLQGQRVRFNDQELEMSLLHLREKDVLSKSNQFVIFLQEIWLQKNRPLERVREELTELNPIANRYIEIGLEFQSSGVFERAIESFTEALEVDPENIHAQVSIASVYLQQGDFSTAVNEYQKALSMDEEDVSARAGLCDAHLALGDAALSRGRTREAIRSFEEVLSINAEHTDARQRMADIHRQNAERAVSEGKFDEAIRAFREALKFTPEDDSLDTRYKEVFEKQKAQIISGYLEKVEKARSAKRWEEAISTLEEALDISSGDEGLIHKLNEIKEAQRVDRLETIIQSAQQASKAGRWGEVVYALEEYLTIEPDDASVKQQLEEARQQYRKEQLKAYREKAESNARSERWEDAISSWQAYLELKPEDRDDVLDRLKMLEQSAERSQAYDEARQAFTSKDYDQAVKLLKAIVIEDETYKDASRLMAEAIELRRTARPFWKSKWLWGGIGGIIVIVVGFMAVQTGLLSLRATPSPPPKATSGLIAEPPQLQPFTETPAPLPTPTDRPTPIPTSIPLAWSRISSGQDFSRDNVTVIAIDPTDPGVIYVGTESAGIYKSIDGGISWQPVHNGLGGAWIHSIVIDPEDPRTLYAGVSTGGIYKTTDGGAHWIASNTGIQDFGWEGAASLAIDPQDSQHLLFTATNGLYETSNGGERWLKIHEAYPSRCFFMIKFHPLGSQNIFALTRFDTLAALCHGGVYKSEDGGQTWDGIGLESREIPVHFHQALAIDQQVGDLLYVATVEGIYGSKDGGESWQRVADHRCSSIEVSHDDGNKVYCASRGGLLISTDSGTTWTSYEGKSSSGSEYTAIVESPHDPQTLIYGEEGIHVSDDGGESWTERKNGFGAGRIELFVSPSDNSIFYLEGRAYGDLYRSIDGGQSWDLLHDVARFLALDSSGKGLYRIAAGELYRSSDRGQNWETISLPIDSEPSGIAIHPHDDQTIYVTYGRDSPPYIYFSTDGGMTWDSAQGMESISDGKLYFDHEQGDVVYIFGDMDTFRSEDSGVTWDRCEQVDEWNSRSYSRLVVDPRDSNRLILATRTGGVLISEDGCQSWDYSNEGLGNYSINSVAIDYVNPDTIYAGTDGGAYLSFDGGEHWGAVNEGLLGATVVYSIVVDPEDPTNVYAATPYGVFKLESR